MALQGSLGQQLGLADVLQSTLAGTSGGDLTLVRGAERAVLHVAEDGLHLLEPEILDPEDVLAAFLERGVLPAQALAAARAAHAGALAVLDHLVASGVVSEGDLLEVVSGAAEDKILDLLTWSDGSFRFDDKARLPDRPGLVGRVPVDRSGVLLRAAQRIDERQTITQAVGEAALLFVSTSPAAPQAEEPGDPIAEVHAAFSGTATVDEIALRLGLGRFGVLKCAVRLVEAGGARLALPQELAAAVASRRAAGQHRVARALALQWAEVDALDTRPLELLAELGDVRERPAEVVAALTLLGHRCLQRGEAEKAVASFEQALGRTPGDLNALRGLRAAAESAANLPLWSNVTLRMASIALADDDASQSRRLASEVLERVPHDLGALITQARACVRAKDRQGVVDVAGAVLTAIGQGGAKRLEREAAHLCRDAVAHLAPQRSDLLRALRKVADERQGSRRKPALVGALLALVAGAGLYLWPPSASTLLERAQEAASEDRRAVALSLLQQLGERFPDSDEASEGLALRARLQATAKSSGTKAGAPTKGPVAPTPSFVAQVEALPAADALAALHARVAERKALTAPPALEPEVARALGAALARVSQGARVRLDALLLLREAPARLKSDLKALREALSEARTARGPEFVDTWSPVLPALLALAQAPAPDALLRGARDAEAAFQTYVRARESHDVHVSACRRRIQELELAESHDACREQAPRLLVAGRLDEVERLYADLEQRLAGLDADAEMAEVAAAARRQGLHEFVRERQALTADVRRGIEVGRAAEAAGDLEAAVSAYEALAARHYAIRFETLIEFPLQVESLPTGASVSVNGKSVGQAPLRLHLPWGARTTVTVEAPGFDPFVSVLEGGSRRPPTQLATPLVPRSRWAIALEGTLEAPAVVAGEDLLVVDRAGRISLLAGDSGKARWTRHVQTVEGVRGRPAVVGQTALVPFVDGRVVTLDLRSGEVVGDVTLPRPVGGLASSGPVAALAVSTSAVIGLAQGRQRFETRLPAPATTGVLAAHGAFWVGTARGALVRIDPAAGSERTFALTSSGASVSSVAPSTAGILVTLTDGELLALSSTGAVHWRAPHLGDLNGAPAETAGLAVAADRNGRTHLFDVRDGTPRGSLLLGKATVGGFSASGGLLVAGLADGRLWVLDADTQAVRVDALVSPKGLVAVGVSGRGEALLLTSDGRVLCLPLPTTTAP